MPNPAGWSTGPLEIGRRLADPMVVEAAAGMGFRDEDLARLGQVITDVVERPELLQVIAALAERLTARIGRIPATGTDKVWAELPDSEPAFGTGIMAMLALLVTAREVAAFHASRGVSSEVSTATLADLGQQVHVHRLTYGEFGLHTHRWLTHAWSGALYWVGRLQFELERAQADESGWMLDVHIPATGPLTPGRVDASLAEAARFFAEHFPEHRASGFVCRSWLLDPLLADRLPDSNLAAFQRRWELDGDRQPGREDVLFFVFNRRGPVDVDALPTDTALRRVVAQTLAAGEEWSVRTGRLPLESGG